MPNSEPQVTEVPSSITELARWFAEGVQAELDALDDQQTAARYELLNGELAESSGSGAGVYRFVVADGTRLPEDSSGLLVVGEERFPADVLSQVGNRINVLVQTRAAPSRIPRAVFTVDDSALLRKLKDFLEAIEPSDSDRFAIGVFRPRSLPTGFGDLPVDPALDSVTGEHRRALEQALGSEVTFIWGPPGTGKTYGIAHLITALLRRGERVLMSSHTHAAVDAALFETISGPLRSDPSVKDGRIVRVGRTADPKIPSTVKLDGIVEARAAEIAQRIVELEKTAAPLARERATLDARLSEWDQLHDLATRSADSIRERHGIAQEIESTEGAIRAGQTQLLLLRTSLTQAQKAWIRKAAKVREATTALDRKQSLMVELENRRPVLRAKEGEHSRRATDLDSRLASQRQTCQKLGPEVELRASRATVQTHLSSIETAITSAREEMSRIENEVITGASVIFSTLTKLYVGGQLDGQRFDAVIIDEVSMALPPLLLIASLRAARRIVLVGDFLQLTPIVRSDDPLSDKRLATDVFRMAGLASGNRLIEGAPAIARLQTQRRMVPPIADLARHLAYGPTGITDHMSVEDRRPPAWMHWLPPGPVIVVDTTDLHCWSGKQPGSQSRFNFYSAHIAFSIAARCAAEISEPPGDGRPPVGIVTPYAAQRRLLARLVADLDLAAWVAAGTVHTFQGSQADMVIFDSVLDEPYYSAMLTNPKSTEEVTRQLNVAVTRARDKLVFIGSAAWLDRNAREASGLGIMWRFLARHAVVVPAADLIGGLPASWPLGAGAEWSLSSVHDGRTYEILDEETFFGRFESDLAAASKSLFGLVPFFGEYRWPRVEPWIRAALERGVEVTLVTPSLTDVANRQYVEAAIENLRSIGAVVITSEGLHGKDIVIDGRVHYTGSLNWASHRGRSEIMHRTVSDQHADLVLRYLQARHIREAAIHEDGTPRRCPKCSGSTRVINQRRQWRTWDQQPMKVGCANADCRDYLRDIDERAPFRSIPYCRVDGRTKYAIRSYGRGKRWQCPVHRDCEGFKVVPGDPEP